MLPWLPSSCCPSVRILSLCLSFLCLFVCGFPAPHLIACHMQIVGQKANGAGLSMICFQHAIINYIYVVIIIIIIVIQCTPLVSFMSFVMPLSLSPSLLTKVTSFILRLFLHSLVIIILHFPARNYTI